MRHPDSQSVALSTQEKVVKNLKKEALECFQDICGCFRGGVLIFGKDMEYADLHDRLVWILSELSYLIGGTDNVICDISEIIRLEDCMETMGAVQYLAFMNNLTDWLRRMAKVSEASKTKVRGTRERVRGNVNKVVLRRAGDNRFRVVAVVEAA